MEIVGKIIQILPLQSGTSARTGNPWSIQSFIIETQEQYPRKVCIEMFGEDRIKANPLIQDEVVTVSFDIESREFNGRWYTSVRAWRVQTGVVAQTAQPVAPQATQQPQAASQPAAAQPMTSTATFDASTSLDDDNSGLPF